MARDYFPDDVRDLSISIDVLGTGRKFPPGKVDLLEKFLSVREKDPFSYGTAGASFFSQDRLRIPAWIFGAAKK